MAGTGPGGDASAQAYAGVNQQLSSLHAERAARRRTNPATAPQSGAMDISESRPTPTGSGATAPVADALAHGGTLDAGDEAGSTNFTVQDVCVCSGHSPHATCLVCSAHKGRVSQVPYGRYAAYCRAFQTVQALHDMRPDAAESMASGYGIRNLVAGEIHFPSFLSMVEHALTSPPASRPHRPSQYERGAKVRFLDLGSGLGRAVVAFALCFGPAMTRGELEAAEAGAADVVSVGVEIREKVHKVVCDAVLPALPAEVRRRVSFLCEDMFNVPCSDADLVFVNATGLEDDVFQRLKRKLEAEMHAGARVMSLSLPLGGTSFEELLGSPRPFRMSWGNCTVFFYEKQ